MVRIERLSDPAQDVLRVLSAGRVLPHAVLAEASGLGAAELRAVVREAAESNVIVADARGRYQFRHALLREVVHDDLLPGEHAELHLALARALERQAEETGEDALITAGIAHHYLSAGAQREALVASVRAADAAERVHAHGEAGVLLERALDLWPRVADAEAQAGCDRGALVRRAGRALINDGAYGRAEALLRGAIDEVDEAADPRAAADLLELQSRALWSLGRASESRDSIARAVSLLPEDDHSPERARILARQAKAAMLQGRFSEALPAAEAAFGAARHAQADGPLADALNAMGYAQILLGDVEDGSARLREAIAISPRGFERTSAWANLAEALHLVGRSQEGLAAAEQGLADTAGEGRFSDWLSLGLLDIRWALGDWEAARAALPPHDRRHIGMTLAYVETLRAAIALADAEHDLARASLERAADVIQGSREPQFLGWFGSLRGELERRCGDLVAARTAVDEGLDAIEFCSEDLPRIALLSETGAAIEADAAQRARDLGDEAAESEAIFRAEMFLARAEAAAGVEDDDDEPSTRGQTPGRLTCGPWRPRGSPPSARTSPARAARPTRRSTPRRPARGARSRAPTRWRSRSCAAPRRSSGWASATTPPRSSPTCSPPPTRSAPPGCGPRPRASRAGRGCRCRRSTRRRSPRPPARIRSG